MRLPCRDWSIILKIDAPTRLRWSGSRRGGIEAGALGVGFHDLRRAL
jgi:hypothetical protein